MHDSNFNYSKGGNCNALQLEAARRRPRCSLDRKSVIFLFPIYLT